MSDKNVGVLFLGFSAFTLFLIVEKGNSYVKVNCSDHMNFQHIIHIKVLLNAVFKFYLVYGTHMCITTENEDDETDTRWNRGELHDTTIKWEYWTTFTKVNYRKKVKGGFVHIPWSNLEYSNNTHTVHISFSSTSFVTEKSLLIH